MLLYVSFAIPPLPDINSEEQKKCFSDVIARVQDLKKVRAFGLLLKISSGKLDQFEKDPIVSTVTQIVEEWFKTPMSTTDRYNELGRILMQPAVREQKAAKGLKPLVKQGSSVDSAISDMSDTPRSSNIQFQYQMPFIGKDAIVLVQWTLINEDKIIDKKHCCITLWKKNIPPFII